MTEPAQKADLHLHTTASDGVLSPQELMNLIHEKGLRTASITDHDTIEGYLSAREYATALGIDLLPGVEISCRFGRKECHMLAYGFDITSEPLLDLLKAQRSTRKGRAVHMVDKLRKLGFDIELDEVRAEAGKSSMSRNHIASVMEQKAYVSSRKEAFDRYLSSRGPAYAENNYSEVFAVMKTVHAAGGVCVLAHPSSLYTWEEIRDLKAGGLDGIEYIHPSHNYNTQKKLKDYAENYNLLLTGGSDFHGIKPFESQLIGMVCVSKERVQRIRTKCRPPQQA